jgi:ATPase family associated with various cellular activities (AAA)
MGRSPSLTAWSSRAPQIPSGPLRPELADVLRLGRRLVRMAVAVARAETPAGVLAEHLGAEAPSLPVVGEGWAAYDHVNLQGALDRWTQAPGRRTILVGLTHFQHAMFTLADLAQPGVSMYGVGVGAVAMARVASGPGGATRACVRCGLYLISEGEARLALLFREASPHSGQDQTTVEVLCTNSDRAAAVLGEIRALALKHSVFRGQILSFESEMFGPRAAPLSFHERPALGRESLVLPAGVLEAIEGQVVGVARHRSRLVASGQHLKRGVLLHGPPGTGKTHTLRYLMSLLTGTTVVMLSGDALQFIAPAVSIARALQPALVIVEDVDLIAEERGMHPGQHPLLFELLNEIDGLGEDADVTFLLTTNRADLLEPALAQRPGRVDQAVELPLPDPEGRRRLLALYRGNLDLQLSDTEPIVAQTEGMTASFFKELLRRAALMSAESGQGDGDDALTVTDDHLRAALDHLLAEQNQLTRILLGAHRGQHPRDPASATDRGVAFGEGP